MNLQAINTLFSIEQENGYEGNINNYLKELHDNPTFFENAYQTSVDNGYKKTIEDFSTLVGKPSEDIKKKNSDLSSPLEGGPSSLDSIPTEASLTSETTPTDLSATQAEPVGETLMGEQPVEEAFVEDISVDGNGPIPKRKKTIQEQIQEEQLKKNLGTKPGAEQKISSVPVNKKIKEQKLKTQATKYFPELNKRAKEIQKQTAIEEAKPKTEEDFFKGGFADTLRGFDEVTGVPLFDFADDMARAAYQGYKQGTASEESNILLFKGKNATPEQIQSWIDAQKELGNVGPSKEMQDYQRTYDKEGRGIWGLMKGLAENPSIIPELTLSSLATMATNKQAIIGGLGVIGTNTAIGAATGGAAGSVVPVAGTAVGGAGGAIGGAVSAVPYAFGVASGVIEAGSTFGELLQDQLNGKPFTKENVKAILEDPEKYKAIRNKAISRGLVIGAVDALTGRLSKAVDARILEKGILKAGNITKGTLAKSALAGSGIEAAGGMAGESLGRVVAGQKQDLSEVALEGIGELGGGIKSTGLALLTTPKIKVNGANATVPQLTELIDTMTPEELSSTKIEIKDDVDGLQNKIQDKIVKGEIKKQVAQANPDLNEPSLNAITDLEKQLQDLESNKTQTAKDKASAIKQQIRNIQENQIQEEVTIDTENIEAKTRTGIDLNAKKGEDLYKTTTEDNVTLGEEPIQNITGEALNIKQMEPEINEGDHDKVKTLIDQVVLGKADLALPENKQLIEAYPNLVEQEVVQRKQDETITPKAETQISEVIAEVKPKTEIQDAVQEQTTNEGVLGQEQPAMELQGVGEGNVQPQVVTEQKETITPEGAKGKVSVNVAPYFSRNINSIEEADQLRSTTEYQQYKQGLVDLATDLDMPTPIVKEVVGGYKMEDGTDIVEISNVVDFDNAPIDKVEEYAALSGALSPEVQEATIAAQYVDEGTENHNANEYIVKVNNVDVATKALKEAGISDFSINDKDGTIKFVDVFDITDKGLQDRIGKFINILDNNKIKYEQSSYKPVESRYVDQGKRKEILRRIKSEGSGLEQRGEKFRNAIEKAIERDSKFQGEEVGQYTGEQPKVITEQTETITPEEKEVTDYKKISNKILGDKELNTIRASLRRSTPDSFLLEMLDAIAKKEPVDTGNFDLDEIINDAIENGVSINNIANLILEDEDLVDNKRIYSKRKAIDYILNIGEKGTLNKAAQESLATRKIEVETTEPTTKRFRMSEGQSEQPDTRNDEEAIVAKMNEASAEEKGLSRGETPPSVETNPIKESSSLSKGLDKVLKFLGLKNEDQLLKNIENFNGIPMILGMSDILAAGTVKDSMGNDMVVDGGLLYNTLGKNIDLAWAGVTKQGSDNQVKQARELYEANKELFDRLWAEGRIPQGHVPMAIMRMGNTAVNSNEAVFRYILPYVKSLSLKNRTEALKTYFQTLKSKAEGNAASFWFTELQDQIQSGNINSKEEIISYLEDLANTEQKAHEKSGKEGDNKKVEKIESFLKSIKRKKNNADRTFDDIKEDLDNKIEKIVPFMLMDYIKSNKIKTIDGFIESVVDGSKQRAQGESNMFSLPVRSFIFNSLISPESTKKANNLPVIKTLLNGVKNADPSLFTARKIYDAIGEKSMLKANQGDVVGIMGIKVADENGNPAGGTLKAEHNNYGYGPEGRLIALIKNPKQGVDVFPEFRAKLSRVFKPSKTGKYPSIESAIQQTGGAFFMDAAFRGTTPAVDEMTDLKVLIGKLRFAFPEVSVATTQKEFDNFLNKEGVRTREKDGSVIYGVTKDGRIFLNPSQQTLRTPIHEFGHIWIDYLRSDASAKKGDELLKKGLELVDGTPEYERALKEYGDRDLALEEALVELMAVKGDTIISAAKKSQFLEWMNAVFKYIKDNLVRSKDFSQSKIKDLTLDEFINIGLADLFSGQKVSGKFDARTAGEASRARFSKEEMSNENFPGYDKLMNRINDIINRSKRRGLNPDKQMDNVIKNVQERSPEYAAATDIQREQIIRDIRKMFGKKEKSAKTFKSLYGLDDVVKVTMPEKKLRDKQIKDLDRGVKMGKAAWLKANEAVTKKVKELEKSKKITSNQAVAVLSKFSKVNMFNEDSVDRFLNYAEKVFDNAIYAEKIADVNSKIKKAKNNIKTKIGVAKGLQGGLESVFNINPTLVPDNVFDTYANLVNEFGGNSAVLNLEARQKVSQDINKVLDAINEQESLIPQLSDILSYSENKVFDNEGKLKYSDTINNMVKNNEISNEDADIMKKYKSEIYSSEPKEKKSQEQIDEEKDEVIKSIKSYDLDSSQFFLRDERDDVKRLNKLIKDPSIDLKSLDPTFIKNLEKTLDNIQNGFFSHFAELSIEKLNSIKRSNSLDNALSKIKYSLLDKIFLGASNVTDKGGMASIQLERNPKLGIDEAFGDYNTKQIYESVFEPTALQNSNLETSTHLIDDRLDKAREDIARSYKKEPNKVLQSGFKIYTYLLQKSFESNPGSKSVNPAVEYIDATIKEIKGLRTKYGNSKTEIGWLEDIKKDYTTDGQIDLNKLYQSFKPAEKKAIEVIQQVNKENEEKAMYTAAVKRGKSIQKIEDYNRVEVLYNDKPGELNQGESIVKQHNNSYKPSTKASTLQERTPGAKPLDFDVFAATKKAARETLTDYYLTEAVRTTRKTFNETRQKLMDRDASEKEIMALNAIENAYESTLEGVLSNSFNASTFADRVSSLIGKNSVKMALTGLSKFGSELLSNLSSALTNDPLAFVNGVMNYSDVMLGEKGLNVMKNVKSIKTNDLYHADELTSKFVDRSSISKPMGISGGKAKNKLQSKALQVFNYTGKPVQNVLNKVTEKSISIPDRVTTLPMWFGKFSNEFKKITGKNVDIDKIADNDEAYMDKYESAIEESRKKADDRAIQTAPTKSAFAGLSDKSNQKAKGNTVPTKVFYAFKDEITNYMLGFQIGEFINARKGIMNAIGKGSMSKREGSALLASAIVRMMVYGIAIKETTNFVSGEIAKAIGIPDDEEEDKKTFVQRLEQNFLSTTLSLFFGRNFGNITRFGMNYAIELANEKYGQALRDGQYDPYDDSLAWSVIPVTKEGRAKFELEDYIGNLSGKYGQPFKTAMLAKKVFLDEKPKETGAKKTLEREAKIKLPLEVFALSSAFPGYKDIKPVVNKYVYEELRKQSSDEEKSNKDEIKILEGLKKAKANDKEYIEAIDRKIKSLTGNESDIEELDKYEEDKKKMEEELLIDKDKNITYDNKSDMKKYNPRLYKIRFGDSSDWKKKYGDDDKVEKFINKEKKKAKDKEYGYSGGDRERKSSRRKSSGGLSGGMSGGLSGGMSGGSL